MTMAELVESLTKIIEEQALVIKNLASELQQTEAIEEYEAEIRKREQ